MTKPFFKSLTHGGHEGHGFVIGGMKGMAKNLFSLKRKLTHALHALHAPTFKTFTFFGGGYTASPTRKEQEKMEPTTIYEPFDGDYGDYDYTKLIDDIQTSQGYSFGPYREICVTLEVDQIRILCSNDEGTEWIDDRFYDIPPEWTLTQLQEMFFGTVYMKTSEYIEKDEETDDEQTT